MQAQACKRQVLRGRIGGFGAMCCDGPIAIRKSASMICGIKTLMPLNFQPASNLLSRNVLLLARGLLSAGHRGFSICRGA
jgi:hypothetical protein